MRSSINIQHVLISFSIVALGLVSACTTSSQVPVSENPEVEKVADGFEFVEGPYWQDGHLLFSDIPANRIYQWTPGGGEAEVYREPSGNSNGITADREGNLVLAQHGKRRIARVENGEETAVATHYQGSRLNSPNDVVVASDGAIYFTDPPYGIEESQKELEVNGVYRVPPGGGEPELLVDDFVRPNGIALSPDESRLYVNDTQEGHIRAFDLEDGSVSNGRLFAELEDPEARGGPDGMKVDAEGNVYSTGPGGVWVFSPGGELRRRISVPGQSTNVGFGGADLKSLYVTSTEGVFRVPVNVRGLQQQ